MSVARINANKLRDIVSVRNFGAVGNGVADDTAAIQAALNAASSGSSVFFPTGNYKITSQIVLNTNNVCVFGDGSTQTIVTYAGANTVNDIFLMGNGTNELKNLVLKGVRVTSSTTMTSGFAFHFRRIVRSYINDVVIDGQDSEFLPSKNVCSGFWFDGCDDVQLTQFKTLVSAEGVRVNGEIGSGPKAGLFLNDGKITGGTIGVRCSGAFGGLYINMVDIIAMSAAGVKIDSDTVAEGNREIFIGSACSIDSVSAGHGVHVTDALGGSQTLQLTGTWIASCVNGLYMNNCATYTVTASGCIIFNNSNDGILVDTSNVGLIAAGCTIRNSGRYGVNAFPNAAVADCLLFSNASGDYSTSELLRASQSQAAQFQKEILIGSQTGTVQTGRSLTVKTPNNGDLAKFETTNAAYTGSALRVEASAMASGTGYEYIACSNSSGGSFIVRGDGTIFADVGTVATPADYAEMFEWYDGNPNDEDRVGCSVALIGKKIKIAEQGDNVIGVVSGAPMVVGDAATFRWHGAHLKDEFNRNLTEEYTVVSWTENDAGEWHYEVDSAGKRKIVIDRQGGVVNHSYFEDAVPEGVTIPATATRTLLARNIENPNWNKSEPYIPRLQRKEWAAVGLLGKLRLKKGQITNSHWVKMAEIGSDVEEWFVK